MATYTVSNLTGVASDYTTIQAAVDQVRVVGDLNNTIKILGGVYQESVALEGRTAGLVYFNCDVYFCNGAKMDGGGVLAIGWFASRFRVANSTRLNVYGLTISNYTSLSIKCGNTAAFQQETQSYHNCIVDGDCYWERSLNVQHKNSIFSDGKFTYSIDGNAAATMFTDQGNNLYTNVEDVRISDSSVETDQLIKYNYFQGCQVGIYTDGYNNLQALGRVGNNKFDSCEFKAYDITFSNAAINALPYSAQTTLSGLNAYIAGLALATTSIITDSEFIFEAITLDNFNYPTFEADSQILNRTIGANNYALSQITPIANADYDFVTDHYISNKTSPTPLVYELTAPRAGKLRRLELQFIRNGNTEQLSATNGAVEITLEKSTDGVNFTAVGTFLSGIDSTTLDFDYVLEVGKAYRASIQPVGAAFGEIEFYGIVGEMLTLEDELSQTDLREEFAAGTVPSKVVTLYNQAHGTGALADFSQPVSADQFELTTGGGIEAISATNYMKSSTILPNLSDFSVGFWVNSVSANDFVLGTAPTVIGNLRAGVNLGFYVIIFKQNATNTGVFFRAGEQGVILSLLDQDFDSIFLNKWVSLYFVARGNTLTIYQNGKKVASSFYDGSTGVSGDELFIGIQPSLFSSTVIQTGVSIEAINLYTNKAMGSEEIIENIKADQHYHKHLR